MSENKKLIFLDVDATLYSKEQRAVPKSQSERFTKLKKKEIKYLLIPDVLSSILKKRFLILGLMDIFVLMVFILLLMVKPSIIR